MKNKKSIYQLELHESVTLDAFMNVKRVPGGWIYTEYSSETEQGYAITSSFVPFSTEFKEYK